MTAITETDRLLLRVPALTDAADSFEIYSDPEVATYIDGFEPLTDLKQAKSNLQAGIDYYHKHGVCHFAAVDKEIGKLIGHCGFNLFENSSDLELVIHFHRRYWNRGFATEAGKAVISFALKNFPHKKIVALAVPENYASQKLLTNLGLVYIEERVLDGCLLKYYELPR